MDVDGGLVKFIQRIAVFRRDGFSGNDFHLDAGFAYVAALAFYLLAFRRGEGGQEIVEIAITGIVPVELAAHPAHEALGFKQSRVFLVGEEPVQ